MSAPDVVIIIVRYLDADPLTKPFLVLQRGSDKLLLLYKGWICENAN
jgi:hypothetical protein